MSSDPHTFFTVYLATGEIVRSGSCRVSLVTLQASYAGETAMEVGQMVSDAADWVNIPAGPLVEQRPGLPGLTATKTLTVDEDWIIPGIPDGSEVYVDGDLIGVVDSTGLTVSFPIAATWELQIIPPFPYTAATSEVTVT